MSERQPIVEPADGPSDLAAVRALFLEYAEALDVDLCFQGFDAELAALPGDYAPPAGGLWLAWLGGEAVGVVALRPLPLAGACEMKRLYLRPAARGRGLGRALARACIAGARERGYRRMLLDTLPSMAPARALYAEFGFTPTAPYNDTPFAGIEHLALALDFVDQRARRG